MLKSSSWHIFSSLGDNGHVGDNGIVVIVMMLIFHLNCANICPSFFSSSTSWHRRSRSISLFGLWLPTFHLLYISFIISVVDKLIYYLQNDHDPDEEPPCWNERLGPFHKIAFLPVFATIAIHYRLTKRRIKPTYNVYLSAYSLINAR